MKNILFVCGRYFPKASPNSICIKNIIDEMQDKSNNIRILCYRDGLQDNSAIAQTKVSRGLVQSALYRLEDKEGTAARVAYKFFNILQKIKQIPFIFCWPLSDPLVTIREIRAAEKMYREEKYDTLVAVYMPLSSLITGYVLKRKHPEIRWIAYFLDSLSGGVAPRFMKQETFEKKAIAWEKRLLTNADSIVFMEASREYHEDLYCCSEIHKSIVYLDLPMLKKMPQNEPIEGPVIIVYVGSLTPAVRSPEFFLKVFSSINNQDWRLIFVGDSSCGLLNEYAKNDKRITVIGRCNHEEAMKYEEMATVLLNLGNNNANLTPSKVFEYMAFGKRIVSTYPIKNESSIKYLNHYPGVLLLDENENTTYAAKQLIWFLESPYEKISYNELKDRFYANTPEAFIDLIQ